MEFDVILQSMPRGYILLSFALGFLLFLKDLR